MIDSYKEALGEFDFSRSIRRDLHRHPELAFQEYRTADEITKNLKKLDLEVTNGLAKTGVLALIEGVDPGPCILLRFDMDALPIVEQNLTDYTSINSGVMHACGHDGHVAIGLTVARILSNHRQDFKGSIKLLFQPAEEGAGGAESMISSGSLKNPEVVRCLGLHIWNEKPLGWLGISSGPVMASAGSFTIRLTGKGGHAAMPHLTIDPVVAAAQVIVAAQTITSRNTDPKLACVISFCAIRSGEAFNIIPNQVEMKGTLRAFEPEVKEIATKRLQEIANGIGEAMGCTVEFLFESITNAVINDPQVTSIVKRAAENIFPDFLIDWSGQTTMASEDFSFYQKEIPGTFFFVGSANSTLGYTYSHHHPRFDFDEKVLPIGAALMAQAAVDLLGSL